LIVYDVGDPNCWISALDPGVDRGAEARRRSAASLNSSCTSVPPVNSML
jgi:hypothetical protein